MRTRELTAEEKTRPYAKYFYVDMAAPLASTMAIATGPPMDPSKALPVERRAEILGPGPFEVEAGYCRMPDGSGYLANRTLMPGVTLDMINWWFAWHGLESLRYMIWNPKAHYGIDVDPETRRRILDPNTPMTAKFQGVTHHVTEDIGGGKGLINISFMTPEDFFGPAAARFRDLGDKVTLVAGYGFVTPDGAHPRDPRLPSIMMHFVRQTPEGVDYRTRFWMGWAFDQHKRPKKLLPPLVEIPVEVPQGLLIHNVEEFANLASILPRVYAEMGGKVN